MYDVPYPSPQRPRILVQVIGFSIFAYSVTFYHFGNGNRALSSWENLWVNTKDLEKFINMKSVLSLSKRNTHEFFIKKTFYHILFLHTIKENIQFSKHGFSCYLSKKTNLDISSVCVWVRGEWGGWELQWE